MKKLVLAFLILFIAAILVGCGEKPSESPRGEDAIFESPSNELSVKKVSVYYAKDGLLVPVTYEIEPNASQVDNALDILFSGITPDGLDNELQGIKLNSFTVNKDVVTVDVSDNFLECENIALAKEQIIYTLTGCDDILKVNIFIDGQPYENSRRRPPFINIVDVQQYEKDKSEIDELVKYLTVYYTDEDKRYLIPVTVKCDSISLQKQSDDFLQEMATAAMKYLIQGMEDLKQLQSFPESIEIRNLQIRDGIAEVDLELNSLLEFHNEAEYAKIAVESVVRTLTSINGIDKVQFLINGNPWGYVTKDVNIQNPLKPDKYYNVLSN